MINKEQIKELSIKFQIDEFSVLREYLQILFLKYFYEQKESENVYFKGGTAIHLMYNSFRFSEDLDFTSLIDVSKLEILLEKTLVNLKKEMSDTNSNIKLVNVASNKICLTKVIKYDFGFKYPLNIKLDLSFREKPLTKVTSPLETLFPVIPYPLVVHIDIEELMAEKIRAIIMRKKGRDLFDLWFLFSRNIKIKDDYMQNKMNYYKLKYNFQDLIKAVQKFDDKELERDLGKFLPKNYRAFIKDIKQKVLEKINFEI